MLCLLLLSAMLAFEEKGNEEALSPSRLVLGVGRPVLSRGSLPAFIFSGQWRRAVGSYTPFKSGV